MTDRNEKYKTDWVRCGTCRTRRASGASLFKHYADHPECKPCTCGHVAHGGDAYPHRRGTQLCERHPEAHIHHAIRAGDEDAILLARGVRSDEAPF